MKITPTKLGGTIKIAASKSQTHRYLIAASLAKNPSTITNLLAAEDITATLNALAALGTTVSPEGVVTPSFSLKDTTINCGASGSTLRFMIPLFMLFDQEVKFVGIPKLLERPFTPYETLFKDKGLQFDWVKSESITIKGKLKPGDFQLEGNVSSQFISGLLFALPLLDGDSTITLTTTLSSSGYVKMTIEALERFGVKVEEKHNQYLIKGNQKYVGCDLLVEGDYSQAAYFVAAGLLGGDIAIEGLNPQSHQPDMAILNFIDRMNGQFRFEDSVLILTRSKLAGCRINLDQTPDLGPILIGLSALVRGKTTFKGLARLKDKESDRLASMLDTLTKLGVKYKYEHDTLTVKGQKKILEAPSLSSFGDHRIAMTQTIIGLFTDLGVEIDDTDCVAKSYPCFFEVIKSLEQPNEQTG